MKDKFYRALIRINSIDYTKNKVNVVIPGWSVRNTVSIDLNYIPRYVRDSIKPGKRLHAKVNIGVAYSEELIFRDWEIE